MWRRQGHIGAHVTLATGRASQGRRLYFRTRLYRTRTQLTSTLPRSAHGNLNIILINFNGQRFDHNAIYYLSTDSLLAWYMYLWVIPLLLGLLMIKLIWHITKLTSTNPLNTLMIFKQPLRVSSATYSIYFVLWQLYLKYLFRIKVKM